MRRFDGRDLISRYNPGCLDNFEHRQRGFLSINVSSLDRSVLTGLYSGPVRAVYCTLQCGIQHMAGDKIAMSERYG